MENIQSLNAAYATSGPMYLSDHEGVASTTYPKGTMTLGRATNRAVYGGRVTAMGSSPTLLRWTFPTQMSFHTRITMVVWPAHPIITTTRSPPCWGREIAPYVRSSGPAQGTSEREWPPTKELDIKDSKLGSSMNRYVTSSGVLSSRRRESWGKKRQLGCLSSRSRWGFPMKKIR